MSAKFWDYTPVLKGVTVPDGKKDRLYNAFLINDDDLLIMTEERMTLMNVELEQLKQVSLESSSPYY